LLRPGGVPVEALGATVGAATGPAMRAPGMLPSHYAPGKPLFLLEASVAGLRAAPAGVPACVGLLAFAPGAGERFAALLGARVVGETLGPDLAVAARGFFAALRRLDASLAEAIYAEPCPSREGLGHAITDRLERAAHRG